MAHAQLRMYAGIFCDLAKEKAVAMMRCICTIDGGSKCTKRANHARAILSDEWSVIRHDDAPPVRFHLLCPTASHCDATDLAMKFRKERVAASERTRARVSVCEKYYKGDRQTLPHRVTQKHTNTGARSRLRRARPQRGPGGSPRRRRLWRRRSRKCGGDGRSEWRPCVSHTVCHRGGRACWRACRGVRCS